MKKYPIIQEFFDILSINSDKNGIQFISTIEAKNFPFYGTQFHPEKNIFMWRKDK